MENTMSPAVGMESRATVWGLPAWYVSAFSALVIAVFGLIALGGSVRIMNAGLACPDWPLCFGDVIPDYHPQVYFEFIHRAVAGLVSIGTVSLIWALVYRSSAPRVLKTLGVISLVILATQVIFGALTVWLQLHSKVVVTHLMLASSFFSLLLWIYLSLKRERDGEAALAVPDISRVRWVAGVTGAAIVGQFFLGGLVASHFASLVCDDFPTCHGQWFPTFRGIIGLHVIHRLGAYTVFAVTLASWLLLRRWAAGRMSGLGRILFGLVCVQICVGISNVIFHTPPLIAVTHLAVGTGLISVAVRQLHLAWGPVAR